MSRIVKLLQQEEKQGEVKDDKMVLLAIDDRSETGKHPYQQQQRFIVNFFKTVCLLSRNSV
eukprot:4389463-Amphidinium_carterae.1